jgi:hypothetical protein
MQNFKRVEKFNHNGNYFKLFIDKNDSIFDVKRLEVTSWKQVKGKRVPENVSEERDTTLFNVLKGIPSTLAKSKIRAYIDLDE